MKKAILNFEGEKYVLTTDEVSEQEENAETEDAMREMFGDDAEYLDEDMGNK